MFVLLLSDGNTEMTCGAIETPHENCNIFQICVSATSELLSLAIGTCLGRETIEMC
jgi:hypothetical protein